VIHPSFLAGGTFMISSALESLMISIVGDASRYERTLKQAQDATRAAASSMQALGGAMAQSITSALTSAAQGASNLASKFELEMSRVEGLVGIAGQQVRAWSDELTRIGPSLGKGPQELAEALFYLTSAGLRGQTAFEALEMSAKASAAGLGTTKNVADAVSSAINAYGKTGMTAAAATDVLTAAVREGKLEAASLAPVMGRVLPIASAMGVTFADVAGSIAAMSRVGASAAEASVGVQAVLMTLRKPGREAKETLASVGLSFQQLRDMVKESGGIVNVLRTLDQAFKGNDEALSAVIPNIRALRGAMNLLSQDAGVVDSVMRGVRDSVGDTDKAFNVTAQTSAFRLDQALSAVRGAFIEVGKSINEVLGPVISFLTEVVKSATAWFSSLSPEVKRTIVIISGIAAAIGPALLAMGALRMALGFLGPQLGAIIGIVWRIGSALLWPIKLLVSLPRLVMMLPSLFMAVLPAILPIAAGIAAVALIVGLVGAAVNSVVKDMGGWGAAWSKVQEKIAEFWEWIRPIRVAMASLFAEIGRQAVALFGWIQKTAMAAWDAIFGGSSRSWGDWKKSATTALYTAEYALGNFGQVGEWALASLSYSVVKLANRIIHFFTATIPAALQWFAAHWPELFGVAAEAAFDKMSVMFAKLIATAVRAGQIIGDAMTLSGSDAKNEAYKAEMNKAFDKLDKDAEKRANDRGKRLNAIWSTMKLPDRQEGEREQILRLKVKGIEESIESGVLALQMQREAEDAVDQMGDVLKKIEMPMALAAEVAGKAGEDAGENYHKGFEKEAGKFDAFLEGSAEHMAKWAEYEQKVIRPLHEERMRNAEKERQAALEARRAERIKGEAPESLPVPEVEAGGAALPADRLREIVQTGKGGGTDMVGEGWFSTIAPTIDAEVTTGSDKVVTAVTEASKQAKDVQSETNTWLARIAEGQKLGELQKQATELERQGKDAGPARKVIEEIQKRQKQSEIEDTQKEITRLQKEGTLESMARVPELQTKWTKLAGETSGVTPMFPGASTGRKPMTSQERLVLEAQADQQSPEALPAATDEDGRLEALKRESAQAHKEWRAAYGVRSQASETLAQLQRELEAVKGIADQGERDKRTSEIGATIESVQQIYKQRSDEADALSLKAESLTIDVAEAEGTVKPERAAELRKALFVRTEQAVKGAVEDGEKGLKEAPPKAMPDSVVLPPQEAKGPAGPAHGNRLFPGLQLPEEKFALEEKGTWKPPQGLRTERTPERSVRGQTVQSLQPLKPGQAWMPSAGIADEQLTETVRATLANARTAYEAVEKARAEEMRAGPETEAGKAARQKVTEGEVYLKKVTPYVRAMEMVALSYRGSIDERGRVETEHERAISLPGLKETEKVKRREEHAVTLKKLDVQREEAYTKLEKFDDPGEGGKGRKYEFPLPPKSVVPEPQVTEWQKKAVEGKQEEKKAGAGHVTPLAIGPMWTKPATPGQKPVAGTSTTVNPGTSTTTLNQAATTSNVTQPVVTLMTPMTGTTRTPPVTDLSSLTGTSPADEQTRLLRTGESPQRVPTMRQDHGVYGTYGQPTKPGATPKPQTLAQSSKGFMTQKQVGGFQSRGLGAPVTGERLPEAQPTQGVKKIASPSMALMMPGVPTEPGVTAPEAQTLPFPALPQQLLSQNAFELASAAPREAQQPATPAGRIFQLEPRLMPGTVPPAVSPSLLAPDVSPRGVAQLEPGLSSAATRAQSEAAMRMHRDDRSVGNRFQHSEGQQREVPVTRREPSQARRTFSPSTVSPDTVERRLSSFPVPSRDTRETVARTQEQRPTQPAPPSLPSVLEVVGMSDLIDVAKEILDAIRANSTSLVSISTEDIDQSEEAATNGHPPPVVTGVNLVGQSHIQYPDMPAPLTMPRQDVPRLMDQPLSTVESGTSAQGHTVPLSTVESGGPEPRQDALSRLARRETPSGMAGPASAFSQTPNVVIRNPEIATKNLDVTAKAVDVMARQATGLMTPGASSVASGAMQSAGATYNAFKSTTPALEVPKPVVPSVVASQSAPRLMPGPLPPSVGPTLLTPGIAQPRTESSRFVPQASRDVRQTQPMPSLPAPIVSRQELPTAIAGVMPQAPSGVFRPPVTPAATTTTLNTTAQQRQNVPALVVSPVQSEAPATPRLLTPDVRRDTPTVVTSSPQLLRPQSQTPQTLRPETARQNQRPDRVTIPEQAERTRTFQETRQVREATTQREVMLAGMPELVALTTDIRNDARDIAGTSPDEPRTAPPQTNVQSVNAQTLSQVLLPPFMLENPRISPAPSPELRRDPEPAPNPTPAEPKRQKASADDTSEVVDWLRKLHEALTRIERKPGISFLDADLD
jgi:TP901 family phage tail tape measure protein